MEISKLISSIENYLAKLPAETEDAQAYAEMKKSFNEGQAHALQLVLNTIKEPQDGQQGDKPEGSEGGETAVAE